MQIPVAVRKMVDPGTHEIFGEEHGHVGGTDAGKRLLEYLKTPILALG